MPTLYELTADYTLLLEKLEDAQTEEETEQAYKELFALGDSIEDKAEAYARIMRSKQAEADAYKAEKDRLAARQKAAENMVERLKARMLDGMEALNINEIPTGIGKWKVQLNPYSCQVTDESLIPTAYRIPQPDKIDKTALLKQYKETGELLPGVEITRSTGIRFR